MRSLSPEAEKWFGPNGGCGVRALAQLCPDKSEQEIMSAAFANGYGVDGGAGGMTCGGWIQAARYLGVKFGHIGVRNPEAWQVPLTYVVEMSRRFNKTLACGLPGHVLVIRNGEILDPPSGHSLDQPVLVMMEIVNDNAV